MQKYTSEYMSKMKEVDIEDTFNINNEAKLLIHWLMMK